MGTSVIEEGVIPIRKTDQREVLAEDPELLNPAGCEVTKPADGVPEAAQVGASAGAGSAGLQRRVGVQYVGWPVGCHGTRLPQVDRLSRACR